MMLRSHSGAACLAAAQARPRAGGCTFLGNSSSSQQARSGPATAIAKATKHAMAPAAEAEAAALSANARGLLPARAALAGLGHPQPAAPLRAGSNAARGTASGMLKQGRSKAAGMRLCWLVGRAQQGQPSARWGSGKRSLAGKAALQSTTHPPAIGRQGQHVLAWPKATSLLARRLARKGRHKGSLRLPRMP